MKKNCIIALLAAALFIAVIITTGCTQDAGSDASSSGNSQQHTPSGGETIPRRVTAYPKAAIRAQASSQYTPSSRNHQPSGQGFEIQLAAAAGKLGVSEQDLKNALGTTTGHQNLTAAAQQLGITRQQLMDAPGFPAEGSHGSRGGCYGITFIRAITLVR
jgi:hypothetical protein